MPPPQAPAALAEAPNARTTSATAAACHGLGSPRGGPSRYRRMDDILSSSSWNGRVLILGERLGRGRSWRAAIDLPPPNAQHSRPWSTLGSRALYIAGGTRRHRVGTSRTVQAEARAPGAALWREGASGWREEARRLMRPRTSPTENRGSGPWSRSSMGLATPPPRRTSASPPRPTHQTERAPGGPRGSSNLSPYGPDPGPDPACGALLEGGRKKLLVER